MNLIDRLRGVDGNRDGADAENSEVGDRPLGPVLGNQGYSIPGSNAQVLQAKRNVTDTADKLRRGNMDPLSIALFADCVGLIVTGDRLQANSRQSRRDG